MSVSVVLIALFCVLPSISSSDAIHYTSSGGICSDTCGYHGYSYTWCKQRGGNKEWWDYCSLEEGLGASGKCASSCDLSENSYRYCKLENGEQNYCGLVKNDNFSEYSQKNNLCIKNCQLTQDTFQCETIHGPERCSPFQDITTIGLPCHNNYRCANYCDSSYRCLTDDNNSEWDLCGRKSLDGCIWATYESNSSQVEICTLSNSLKDSKVIFRRERRDSMLSPTKEEFKNAVHLIGKIMSVPIRPDPGPQATVYFYKLENTFCKGIHYTNVELRVTFSEQTIAHIVFPAFVHSAQLLRLAFYTSLHSTFYPPAYTIAVSLDEPMLCSIDHQQ